MANITIFDLRVRNYITLLLSELVHGSIFRRGGVYQPLCIDSLSFGAPDANLKYIPWSHARKSGWV